MILNPHHNPILLHQGDVPKDHEKHPKLLLNQNTTVEVSIHITSSILFHDPGISHANVSLIGFPYSICMLTYNSPIQLSIYALLQYVCMYVCMYDFIYPDPSQN